MKYRNGKYILNQTELNILRVMTDNAKLTMSEVGEMVGKSRTQVSHKIKELEEAGIIEGYTVLVNWDLID